MKIFKTKIKLVSLILVFVFLISSQQVVWASDDCDDLDGDAKDECEALEKKIKAYEKIIKLKDKQGDALTGQINTINNQKIATGKEIKSISSEIDLLQKNIKAKEKEIQYKKEILKGLLQANYERNQVGVFELSILKNGLESIFSHSDYINQSGVKIREIMTELNEVRGKLKDEKNESEDKKDELEDKKESLASLQKQKHNLLVKTQGEEAKYKDLLKRVEAQKKELFNFSEAGNLGELFDSLDDYDKPDKDDRLSTSWYYSQRDSRWADRKIGNSNSKMKDYGCAVTSVAMVFTKLGSRISPKSLSKESIFYYDLIRWPGSWSGGIKLESSISHGNVSWSKIKKEAKKGNPVIVYIKRSKGGGHYVVIAGKDDKDYIVHDPYFGPNLYLKTSMSLVGKLGSKSSTYIDQMIIYDD